jgi:hypothetical protein
MVNAMTTRRPLVAALVTLCGLAITAGAALPWVDARGTRPASGITHTSLIGLRHLAYAHSATSTSFAVAVAAAGIVVVVGGLAASRLLTGPFSVIALATGALWIWLNARHYNASDLRYNDLRIGAWLTIGGSLIAMLATFRIRRKDASADTAPWESFAALNNDGRYDAPHIAPMPPAPRPPAAQQSTFRHTPTPGAYRPARPGYRDGFRPIR